jgi:hypothetical protein
LRSWPRARRRAIPRRCGGLRQEKRAEVAGIIYLLFIMIRTDTVTEIPLRVCAAHRRFWSHRISTMVQGRAGRWAATAPRWRRWTSGRTRSGRPRRPTTPTGRCALDDSQSQALVDSQSQALDDSQSQALVDSQSQALDDSQSQALDDSQSQRPAALAGDGCSLVLCMCCPLCPPDRSLAAAY